MVKIIYLAGGCFWGVEEYFSYIIGITDTQVGYANGVWNDPTYEDVCSGNSGFAETTKLTYDDAQVTLKEILNHYFKIIDPTILNRQGFDSGTQYRTGIYFIDDYDKEIITKYINSIKSNYNKPIVTEIMKLKNYFPAEDYHQKYLKKNPNGYCHIDISKVKNNS